MHHLIQYPILQPVLEKNTSMVPQSDDTEVSLMAGQNYKFYKDPIQDLLKGMLVSNNWSHLLSGTEIVDSSAISNEKFLVKWRKCFFERINDVNITKDDIDLSEKDESSTVHTDFTLWYQNQKNQTSNEAHEFKENIQELIEISSNYVKMINRVIPINEDDQKFVDELASKYLSALKKEPFPKK